MKKKFLSVVALGILASALCACGADNAQEATEEATTEATTEAVDAAEDENNEIVYMGGLYAADGQSDINLALFKSSGTPVVIIQEGSNIYYGEFITEDATLEDGREYVKITVEDKVYGYHFNDDMTGFVVDQDGKAHEAKELDESVAMDMQKETEGTADASANEADNGEWPYGPYYYTGNDPIEQTVFHYISDELGKNYDESDVTIPSPIIIAKDDSNKDDILVWGIFWIENYNLEGDTFKCVSGGAYPGLMHMKTAETESGYDVTSFDAVEDGAGYDESAKKIFGDKYDQFVKADADSDAHNKLRAELISEYVKDNNIPATKYQDEGWDPVELDLGGTTDASGSVAGEYVSADEEGGSVILKDDNTGSLNFQDVIDITWDGDAYKITEKESGNSYPYTIDGNELTLDYDGNKLVFTKK